MLLDEIRGVPRLHPVWVVEPPKQPGKTPARALVGEMLSKGVRAARLPMRRVPPLPWLWDDICGALEEHSVPCFLDFGGGSTVYADVSTLGELTAGDVNGVRDIALAHPDLPMVLSHIMGGLGVHYGVVPLIRRLKNLYIDITGIIEYWREVAVEVGPERVLFATGMPFTDPGILVSNVQYATEIDEESKRMICGDNLRRLMEGVR
jgi:predicted TIM-barrel fold metal-dependent hydrolase